MKWLSRNWLSVLIVGGFVGIVVYLIALLIYGGVGP